MKRSAPLDPKAELKCPPKSPMDLFRRTPKAPKPPHSIAHAGASESERSEARWDTQLEMRREDSEAPPCARAPQLKRSG
eukprot:scaffold8110_cov267-Pinguiococcus_pyrenoidosus.AAC.7